MQRYHTGHEVPQSLQYRHPYTPSEHLHVFEPNKPHQVREAFGHRGITKLVDVLRFHEATQDELVEALTLLFHSAKSQEKAIEMVHRDIIPALDERIQSPYDRVRTHAVFLLSLLADFRAARDALQHAGTVSKIVRLSDQSNEPVPLTRHAAALCIARLSRTHEGWAIVHETPEAVAGIAKALAHNWTIIHAIRNICSLSSDGIEQIIQQGNAIITRASN